MNRGIQEFYFTSQLPQDAVAIAKVETKPASPAELTDINNSPYGSAALSAQGNPGGVVYTATGLNQSVTIHGYTTYRINNQFFELTDQIDEDGQPLYYQHVLSQDITNIKIVDLEENVIDTGYTIKSIARSGHVATYILHSFDKLPYQVHYIDSKGFLHTDLLKYDNVIAFDPFSATDKTYTTSTIFTTVLTTDIYYIRWVANNGYQLLKPYGTTPNDPWFVRVRFNMLPVPPEWATQVWNPHRPYLLATWVPGKVLSQHVLQLERQSIFINKNNYPDILVYDKNFVLKYALAGRAGHGFLFPWRLNQFTDIDRNTGRLQVSVELEDTDYVFGFYTYQEPDVVYKELNLNPYTNPNIRNKVIQFFVKTNGVNPLRYIYYKILNEDGSLYSTNDADLTVGTAVVFGTVLVGQSSSIGNFTLTDIRQRGGGLAPAYQGIPEAINFWDLGYWDGKPYPAGGAMAVYLPIELQNTFNKNEIEEIVRSVCPMGTGLCIRFYDQDGNEMV